MTFRISSICVLLLVLSLFLSVNKVSSSSKTKGWECVVCTYGVGLIEQMSQVHNQTITKTLQKVCELFKDVKLHAACENIVKYIGPQLIVLFSRHYTPDVICARLSFCSTLPDGSPKCHLFPRSENDGSHRNLLKETEFQKDMTSSPDLIPFCQWPGVDYLCDIIDSLFNYHKPPFDLDGDGFSTQETLRGSSWRGKDCNDLDAKQYPGAIPIDDDVEVDSNCNGIYGIDYKTGEPYEKLFCKTSNSRGVLLLGDSAGAHFHIPEQWLNPSELNSDILTHLPYALLNGMDWPMTSFSTGYKNITWPIVDGFTVSVYDFLRDRNRCNHRNYHNIGVNGAGSADPLLYLHTAVGNRSTDIPLLLFYAFVGNDVCNPNDDTLSNMTTPEQMRKNVIETLDILETLLPAGSHVLMTGLANGSFLYEGLHTRFYPLGKLNKNIRYPDFYDFLSCVGANPCKGWMTSNSTLRSLTTQRATELSKVIERVAAEFRHSYRHFDLEYLDCPLTYIVERWEKVHGIGTSWQLIESTDGFHPNQLANNLIARYVWRYMERHHPHFIGHVNYHNKRILDTCGDQGGY